MRHASAMGNVELIYAGLDVLGSTPWVINQKIFDVVLKVWNTGEGLGKLPPSVYPVPEPELPYCKGKIRVSRQVTCVAPGEGKQPLEALQCQLQD